MFLGSIIYVENIEKQNIQEEESIEKTISEEKVPVKIRDKTFYFNPILAKQMTEDILPWLRSIPKKNVCKSKPNIVQQSGKSTPPSGARLHKNVFGLRPLYVFIQPHFASPANCFAVCLFGLAKRLLPPNVM